MLSIGAMIPANTSQNTSETGVISKNLVNTQPKEKNKPLTVQASTES